MTGYPQNNGFARAPIGLLPGYPTVILYDGAGSGYVNPGSAVQGLINAFAAQGFHMLGRSLYIRTNLPTGFEAGATVFGPGAKACYQKTIPPMPGFDTLGAYARAPLMQQGEVITGKDADLRTALAKMIGAAPDPLTYLVSSVAVVFNGSSFEAVGIVFPSAEQAWNGPGRGSWPSLSHYADCPRITGLDTATSGVYSSPFMCAFEIQQTIAASGPEAACWQWGMLNLGGGNFQAWALFFRNTENAWKG